MQEELMDDYPPEFVQFVSVVHQKLLYFCHV